MNKPRIIYVGSQFIGHTPDDGETMKNQLMRNAIQPHVSEIIPIDLRKRPKRYWYLALYLWNLLFRRDSKIIISASVHVAYRMLKVAYRLGWRKNIYYWVVGGLFDRMLVDGKLDMKYYTPLEKIILQGESMELNLRKCGLTKVLTVPNSKLINYLPSINEKKDNPFRFIFISRVIPEKGVEYIFEASQQLQSAGINNYVIDMWGRLDNNYKDRFIKLLSKDKKVSFKGVLNLTNNHGYDILASYNCMLFPTYHPGEGFPGIVIDSYIAGLPIIASDFHENNKVVKSGYNGVLIPVHDIDALTTEMRFFISGRYDILKMSNNARSEAMKYDIRNIINEKLLKQIGLIN